MGVIKTKFSIALVESVHIYSRYERFLTIIITIASCFISSTLLVSESILDGLICNSVMAVLREVGANLVAQNVGQSKSLIFLAPTVDGDASHFQVSVDG